MLLDWLLAFAPLALIVFLMVGRGWGAAKAGPVGWIATAALAVLAFGAGAEVLGWGQVRALLLSLDVLPIVWGAFLLFRVADEAGAIRVIGQALLRLTGDRGMQALLIAWAFATFLQGVGGFGVPVVVTAPLLADLGFPALASVLLPSIGHSWSVTFGSLASSFQALIAGTGLPGENLAHDSAILLGLAGLLCGGMVAVLAGGWRNLGRLLPAVLTLGLVMGGVQYLLATNGMWNIAGFGSGMAGLAAGLLIARLYPGPRSRETRGLDGAQVVIALTGYGALVAVTLLVQLTPLRELLDQFALQVPIPQIQTARGFVTPADPGPRLALLRHAGTVLTLASLLAFVVYRAAGRYASGAFGRILSSTVRGVAPSTVAVVAMVSTAVLMSYAGMTDLLARGLADGIGGLFPLASPWIGALGAFISGSNTNSNLLFAMLQRRTAELLGLRVPWILAAQTAGGAVGSVVSPTKVVVGVGSSRERIAESEVMRRLLGYTALLIACLSLITWIWTRISAP